METLITYTLLMAGIYFMIAVIFLHTSNAKSTFIFKFIPFVIASFYLIGVLYRIGIIVNIGS